MEKLTIKAYAVRHKLSIFDVVKKLKSGDLHTQIVEENGKEITYILLDKSMKIENNSNVVDTSTRSIHIKHAIDKLNKEVQLLRTEIEVLKKRL